MYRDEIDDTCGICYNTTKEGGTLLSPGYTGDSGYGKNKNCFFRITVCEGKNIKLKFIEFSLERSFDWMYVSFSFNSFVLIFKDFLDIVFCYLCLIIHVLNYDMMFVILYRSTTVQVQDALTRELLAMQFQIL